MEKKLPFENIVIAGTGRIAHSVVHAMKNNGIQVTHLFFHTEENGEKFAKRFGIPNRITGDSEFPSANTLYIIAVSDEAIPQVAEVFAAKSNYDEKTVFVHLSGSYPASELRALAVKKANIASLHIMQTFPDTNPIALAGLRAMIEAPKDEVFDLLADFAEKLNLIHYRLTSEQKTIYHISGVFISNFLVGNVHSAEKIFKHTGLTQKDFTEIFTPILRTTVQNVLTKGSIASLSGPLERGDISVVEKHIAILKNEMKDEPDILRKYLSQSIGLLKTARVKNPGKKSRYDEMEAVLKKYLDAAE